MCNMAGPQPIQVTEVKSYLSIAGIEDPFTRLKYLRLIQQLDRVSLDHSASRAAKQAK